LHISILLKRIFCGTMAARAKRALVAFLRFALLKGRTQGENRPQALVFLVAVAVVVAAVAVLTRGRQMIPLPAASNNNKPALIGGGGGGSDSMGQANNPPPSGGNNNNGGGNNNNVGVASSIGTTATGPVVPSGQTQAQSAMDRFGSRANNPQTVSEILMAQQSLRSLAPPPPIQSMTKTAELGFAIPGAVTNDASQQPYSMGSLVPTSPLSTLELSLEFDEDYQDAKSQLEAAGYVVDENGIVRTTTGVEIGPLSEVVNVGRTTSPPPPPQRRSQQQLLN
jgi:hypothetical protein